MPPKSAKKAPAAGKEKTPVKEPKKTPGKSAQAPASPAAASSNLDIALARKAVAALFSYEAKKQESKAEALIEDSSKSILAVIQLREPVGMSTSQPFRVA